MRQAQNNNKIPYALNQDGVLVHVDSVPNGNNCGCICPACRKPLQARNAGSIKMHHFAHQSGVECPNAYETVMHLLAKEKIQKAFYENKVFNIDFEYNSYCPNKETCKFVRYGNCTTKTRKTFNLKDFYDSCEQEIPYDEIRRRSDLKIWSSTNPQRAPIYIEIFVTHPSDDEKLHSGCKIIEVKIENETDIENILSHGFVEDEITKDVYGEPIGEKKTKMCGFKNEDYNNKELNEEIAFSRYILYKSGKSQCRQETCMCKELKRVRPNALYEVCFHNDVALGIYELAKWMGYRNYGIPNCLLCEKYVDSYDDTGKICKMYKILGLSRYEQHDTARAKDCKYFKLNTEEMNETLKEPIDENCPITEL